MIHLSNNDFVLTISKNYIFLFFILLCCLTQAQNDSVYAIINQSRKLAKDKSLDLNKRYEYARKAIKLSKKTKNDSTLLASNRVLSLMFIYAQNSDSLLKINKENLYLAGKLKDTLKMAYATNNIAYSYDLSNKSDSAYYYYLTAEKYYNKSNSKVNQAIVFYSMASIQETERDFIGSESNAINAIKILDDIEDEDEDIVNEWQWSVNNLLAIVSGRIENYDEAIEYHNKALSFTKNKNSDPYNALFSRINTAILYRRKKEYSKSIELSELLLKDGKLKTVDPSSYVTVISNIAYAKFLKGDKDYIKIELKLKEAFNIAKSVEDEIEISSVGKYLSEYYLKLNKRDSALHYADISLKLAREDNANQTILDVLLLKSKIEEGESSKSYLFEHIKLSDSLILAERTISNKLARINYRTDVIKKEKEAISKQNQWLIITSVALLITLLFLYIIKTQREKNKELQLAQQQQEANEEIYNLMLSQQDKMDEARALEKKRVSQELHDGVLGKLFGTRLTLDSLNFIKTEEAVLSRGKCIKELQNIEQEIRKVSHDLNTDFIVNSGFVDIIETLVENQTQAYGLEYGIEADQQINWDITSNKTKIHIYRIIQESLQNIYKHAKATRVDINFEQKNNLISLDIKDNGSGFDINKTGKGIGFKNMKDRLKEIEGILNIKTKINEGTTITIEVPS